MRPRKLDFNGVSDEPTVSIFEAFEDSLNVGLISSKLVTCGPGDPAIEVWGRPGCNGFDQVPVSDGERIVGVLLKNESADSVNAAQDVMQRLADKMLISKSTGILTYISVAAGQPYHLVVDGNGIDGIVTPSDLLKLPVRTVLFTLLTRLELIMGSAIRALFPSDGDWISLLKPNRQAKLEKEFGSGSLRGIYITRLSFAQWCDKRDILNEGHFKKHKTAVCDFYQDMKRLEELRNDVAHANNYGTNISELNKQVSRAIQWIGELSKLIDAKGTSI